MTDRQLLAKYKKLRRRGYSYAVAYGMVGVTAKDLKRIKDRLRYKKLNKKKPSYKEYQKQKRIERRRQGLCQRCGQHEPAKNRVTCNHCLTQLARSRKS